MLGPTAAGKSDLALALAERLGAEILSVDSMQVYRGMDIGTAKPTREERERVPHHMIDLAEPEEEFTVARFQREARAVIDHTTRPLIIAGGSGLHFRAVVDPMRFPPHDAEVRARLERRPAGELVEELLAVDPEAGRYVDLANPRRVVRALEIWELTGDTPSGRARTAEAADLRAYRSELPVRAVGVDPGAELADRVRRRLTEMRRAGFLEEVERLAPRLGRTASQAVGYRQLLDVVEGRVYVDEGFARAEAATLALARRQRTFFRRDPRIRWLPWTGDLDELVSAALATLLGEVRCGS